MDELEKKLWKKVNRYLKFLSVVPFLRMVAVCNNLAFNKVDEESDIDLFVVAKSGRLFIVRIIVTGILHLLGVRRHGDKVAGRFCLSFFADDQGLDLSKIAIEKDIYLAYWIRSMLPVIDDGVSAEFLAANTWARRFFEDECGFAISNERLRWRQRKLQRFFEWFLNGRFGDWLEKRMQRWQMKRALNKSSLAGENASLLVEEHILKFHNIDRRREYKNQWFELYGEEAKLSKEKFLSL